MTNSIYTTYIESEGCFIKVWGQRDKTVPLFIENHMLQMKPSFDAGIGVLARETLVPGLLCCAKFVDDFYYRTRIIDTSMKSQGKVEVMFIDYGNRVSVPAANIHSIYSFISSVISLPPQANPFILAKAQCININSDLEKISEEIRYMECTYQLIDQVGSHSLITLSKDDTDITNALIAKNLVREIAIPMQQSMLMNTAQVLPKSSQMCSACSPRESVQLITYKSHPLPVESEHRVYVTYVTDGPLLFSVQLKAKEAELQRLMMELNKITLSPLDEMPLPGYICLALSGEDNVVCRAVVTNVINNEYKIFFVDFGNVETRSLEHLFQIPFKYVIPKVMANRFALKGLETYVVSDEMKVAFKKCVTNKKLKMLVSPSSSNTTLAMCDLWDENESVLGHVLESSVLGYPDGEPIATDSCPEVQVSFVFSCIKFYVQLTKTSERLKLLMSELQAASLQSIAVNKLREYAPCIARYPGDGLFYRAQVISVDNEDILLKYVDYGNEEIVNIADVRAPLAKFMLNLRPQAIECCLSDYQYLQNDEKRNELFEQLALEEYFSMKVTQVQNNRHYVELLNADNVNVESLLAQNFANLQLEEQSKTPPNNIAYDTVIKVSPDQSNYETRSPQRNQDNYSNCSDKSDKSFNHRGKQETWNNENRWEKTNGRLEKVDRNDFSPRKSERNYNKSGSDYNNFKDTQRNGKRDFNRSEEHVDYVDLTQTFQYVPLQGNEEQVTISWFFNPMNFYSQLQREKKKFDKMMQDIQYAYKNRTPLESADVGHSVIAEFPEDHVLYRAIIQQTRGNKYKVFYVDFGNSAISTKIFPIERRFMEIPAQAVKCALLNVQLVGSEWPSADTLAQYFAKESYSCNFMESVNEKYYKVDLIAEGNSITEGLIAAGIVEDVCAKEQALSKEKELPECDEERAQSVQEENQDSPPQPLPGFEVELTHFDNPSEFYLVLSSALSTLDELQDNLQTQIATLDDIETVSNGIVCAAPYSADNIWYRAQVLDADSDITTVRFIDYGNTDVLSSSIKIKTLPPNLLAQEQHARRCSLFVQPPNGEWTSIACEAFEQLTTDAQLSAIIMSQDEKTTFVRLFAGDKCINDVFIAENFGEEMQLTSANDTTGFVSHLISPSEFWIQFEHSINDLEWIAELLTNAANFNELKEQTPGTLCAAIFPDDDKWYRARILSITGDGFELLFLDYGNSCICSSLRELPEELLLLPPMAHKCKLMMPGGVLEWSPNAVDKFTEISADGETVFNVIRESQGEANLVRLLIGDEDVSEMLRPQLIDAEVTHCGTSGHISIRSCELEASFADLQAKMLDLVDAPLAEDVLVAAQHKNVWYRARILGGNENNYQVALIDAGLDVDVNNIRLLPEEMRGIEAMAKHIQVQPLPHAVWNQESDNYLRTLLENANWRVQVEFLSDVVANLYVDGQDVRASIPNA